MTTFVRAMTPAPAGNRDRLPNETDRSPGDRARLDRDRLLDRLDPDRPDLDRLDRDQSPGRGLVMTPTSGRDAIAATRRSAALAMIAAVVLGSCGAAMAASTILTGGLALGLVLGMTMLVGVLIAGTAWRHGTRDSQPAGRLS
jgi:hypothetical protein